MDLKSLIYPNKKKLVLPITFIFLFFIFVLFSYFFYENMYKFECENKEDKISLVNSVIFNDTILYEETIQKYDKDLSKHEFVFKIEEFIMKIDPFMPIQCRLAFDITEQKAVVPEDYTHCVDYFNSEDFNCIKPYLKEGNQLWSTRWSKKYTDFPYIEASYEPRKLSFRHIVINVLYLFFIGYILSIILSFILPIKIKK